MPVQRSGAFTTFAVLNLIVGSFLLLCGVCSGIDWTVTVNNQDMTQQLKAFLNQEIPNYTTYKIGGAVLSVVLGLGLIASGVGLLNMQNWARVLAIIFCVIGILHHSGLVYLQLALVNPALERFFGRFPFLSFFPKFVTLLGVVEYLAGAIFFLIQLAVLPASSAGVPVQADYDYDEDERPRHRRRIEDEDDDEEDFEEDDRPPRRRT
jgi:hypothetical protein